MGNGFAVPASGNGFSKYSGVVVPAGRNRPRFAIQAHCGLLVTSVSPNCCPSNGILRKSYFRRKAALREAAAKPFPISSPCLPPPFFFPARICSQPVKIDSIDFSPAGKRFDTFGGRFVAGHLCLEIFVIYIVVSNGLICSR